MHKQFDTTFREVLTQVGPADSVRLLPWSVSNADNPGTAPTFSVGEAVTTAMQPRWKPLLMTPLQDLRDLMPLCLWFPQHQQVAQHIRLTLHLQLSPFPASRTLALQLGSHTSCSASPPNPKSMIISPTVYLITNVTRGLTSESR